MRKSTILTALASLFSTVSIARADITMYDNVTMTGNFSLINLGSETVVPYWTKTKGASGYMESGSFRFDIYGTGTNTKLFSTQTKIFTAPFNACGKDNQGNNNTDEDAMEIEKSNGTSVAYARRMLCHVYDNNGNDTGNELDYSHVYLTDLNTRKVWWFQSKSEKVINIEFIPDQNNNGSEELSISLDSDSAKVVIVDPTLGSVLSSNKYNIGNPGK